MGIMSIFKDSDNVKVFKSHDHVKISYNGMMSTTSKHVISTTKAKKASKAALRVIAENA